MPRQKTKSDPSPAHPKSATKVRNNGKIKKADLGREKNTKASLSSLIKSSRDIMRKDAGLNGDLDRLPQLSWILFLKCYDDLEIRREEDAKATRQKYKPIIPPPYRWRDWASDENEGTTGEDLIKFINDGLLPTLRGLSGSDERLKVAEVFKETYNRMLSGYLLRDVVNLVDGIHFQSKDEIFTLAHLYESMLKEMRDAAGDSGEFYTPRPVVKLIVDRVKPKLKDTILDPACGTGGFLVEAYEYLKPLAKNSKDQIKLQSETLYGVEKKPLPYLLGTMNLLLHGIENPNIRRDNALKNPLNEIGEKDRFDVIVTNPPFGGEEEAGIQLNFPESLRASETALLFMQFVMRSLKHGGRCGVVVPNGFLFGDGVSARIKEQLLRNFNLHTIVRLPRGVFTPYTPIETNLLFFDRTQPTTEIWYYEHSLPEGRNNYTKTRPMQFEEFAPLIEWWEARVESEHAWKVRSDDVLKYDENKNLLSVNLDIKNPNGPQDLEHLSPDVLLSDIIQKHEELSLLIKGVSDILFGFEKITGSRISKIRMGDLVTLVKRPATEFPDGKIRSLGVKWWGKGAHVAEEKEVTELRADRFIVRENDLIYNDMWARHGSVAIVPTEFDGYFASAHFPTWEINQELVFPPYFSWCFRSPWFWSACAENAQGSTGRNAISKTAFKEILMPIPSLEEQKRIVSQLDTIQLKIDKLQKLHTQSDEMISALLPSVLDKAFKGE